MGNNTRQWEVNKRHPWRTLRDAQPTLKLRRALRASAIGANVIPVLRLRSGLKAPGLPARRSYVERRLGPGIQA